MKSYAVHPEALAKSASVAFDMGAEAVYVVDSAGGMLPKEVQEYIQAIISENTDNLATYRQFYTAAERGGTCRGNF